MNFYDLKGCNTYSLQEIGGKAKWIGKMDDNCFNQYVIPKGICIKTGYFEKFINSHPQVEKIVQLRNQCISDPIFIRRNLSKIRELITNSTIDEQFIDRIIEDLDEIGIDINEGIAVRSSSQCEDSIEKSFAGAFVSTLNIKDRSALKKAILATWASQFSEGSFVYRDDTVKNSMAVIIQEMVDAEFYGVAFSKAPFQSDKILIEEGNTSDQVEDKGFCDNTYLISREGTNFINGKIQQITDTILYFENKFNCYFDIEWAYKDGKLVLFQMRPQTDYYNVNEYEIINCDDFEKCNRVYLGKCEKYHRNAMGKGIVFRKGVLDAGFSVYKQFYLIVNKIEFLQEAVTKCIEKFENTRFVIVEFGDKAETFICKKEELFDKMQEKVLPTPTIYCRIGEMIEADKSGYAAINEKNECIIEYTLGRMSSVMSGKQEPIKCVIKDGCIEDLTDVKIEYIDILNDKGKKETIRYFENEKVNLSKEECLDLEKFTRILTKKFPSGSFEWYLFKNRLYGKGISIEENIISLSSDYKNIISKGSVTGEIIVVDDIDKLDNISDAYDLSLYAHQAGDYLVLKDDYIVNLTSSLKTINNPIIVAERPTNGLIPIINDIKGCIFKHGSVLSHVSICLREKGIPACFSEEVFRMAKNGQIVEIQDGKSRIID